MGSRFELEPMKPNERLKPRASSGSGRSDLWDTRYCVVTTGQSSKAVDFDKLVWTIGCNSSSRHPRRSRMGSLNGPLEFKEECVWQYTSQTFEAARRIILD